MLSALAGLWPLVWKIGGTGLVIAGLVGFSFLTPPWVLPGLKKIALWVAGALAYGLITYSVGVHDEGQRRDAKEAAGLRREAKDGAQILRDAERATTRDTPDSVRNDPWNRDRRKD